MVENINQGALVRALGAALAGRLHRDVQPEDQAGAGQPEAVGLAADDAAPTRYDPGWSGLLDRATQRAFLAPPESGLALAPEDRRDVLARLGRDDRVEIDEFPTQPAPEREAETALSGAGEADQPDRLIRSG